MRLDMDTIEDVILGMAELVQENRYLREQLKELDLDNRTNKAYAERKWEEAERLSELVSHNLRVKMSRSCGWLTSDDALKYD